jgi:sensor domain CHASE-containing protein
MGGLLIFGRPMSIDERDAVRYRASENVAASNMGDELAILDFGSDTYFTLNSTGAYLWHQLATPKSMSDLADSVALDFGVEASVARADVEELLADLLRLGLVTPDESA